MHGCDTWNTKQLVRLIITWYGMKNIISTYTCWIIIWTVLLLGWEWGRGYGLWRFHCIYVPQDILLHFVCNRNKLHKTLINNICFLWTKKVPEYVCIVHSLNSWIFCSDFPERYFLESVYDFKESVYAVHNDKILFCLTFYLEYLTFLTGGFLGLQYLPTSVILRLQYNFLQYFEMSSMVK